MTSTAAHPPSAVSPKQLVDAFEGPIKRVWHSPLYFLGLLLVTLAMILLPLCYLALIAAVGYALYYHAVEHAHLVKAGRAIYVRGFVYVVPLIVGVILLLFMVKPLFARPARKEKRLSLVPDHEPVLFAFVERLCEVVGAPKPRRIDVTCDINAGAAFRRGWLSMFGSDLTLTIGVPLVAGLTLPQFAGILAHEFGHFTQGLGLRLSYIVRSVNFWFARLVYERDQWDELLIATSEDDESQFSLVCLLARPLVWLTRMILWILMMLGHLISCTMMRQMEFDADRYEIRLAGSKAFEAAARRTARLLVASQALHQDLARSWQDGRLGDNFPLLLTTKLQTMPKELRDKINAKIGESKTGWLDTHPSDAARIRRARKENTEGIFKADGPASVLFSGFEALSKAVTFAYYQDLVGPRFGPQHLISTEDHARRQTQLARGQEAADRYFHGCLTPARPITVDRFSSVSKLAPKDCLARLRQARQALQKSLPVVRRAYRQYARAAQTIGKAKLAQTLLKAGVMVDAEELKLPASDTAGVTKARNEAQRIMRSLEPELATIESVVRLRIECALALLNVDQVAHRVKQPEKLRKRADQLLSALSRIRGIWPQITELREDHPSLCATQIILAETGDEDVVPEAINLMESQRTTLEEVRGMLSDHPYPFQHADGAISLGRYAVGTMPSRDDLTGMVMVGERVLDNMDSLYVRLMGELAQIAERVEAALGLKPLAAESQRSTMPAADNPTA